MVLKEPCIEKFWFPEFSSHKSGLANSLWAFKSNCIIVWFDVCSPHQFVKLSLDFYPLCKEACLFFTHFDPWKGILLQRGLVLGIKQRLSMKNVFSLPLFNLDVEVLLSPLTLLTLPVVVELFALALAYSELVG